jgi:hypothetical protein
MIAATAAAAAAVATVVTRLERTCSLCNRNLRQDVERTWECAKPNQAINRRHALVDSAHIGNSPS